MNLNEAVYAAVGGAMVVAAKVVAEQPQLVMQSTIKPRPTGEGGWELPHSVELNEATLAAISAREMLGTPALEGLVRAVQEDERLRSALPAAEGDPGWWIDVTLLQPFIQRVFDVSSEEGYEPDHSAIDRVLDELLAYHKADTVPLLARCSVFNLQGQVAELEVSETLKLTRLSTDDRARLVTRVSGGATGQMFGLTSVTDVLGWEYLLESRVDWVKGTPSPLDHESSGLSHAFTALRLLRSGRVMPGVTWLEAAEPWAAFADPNSGIGGVLGYGRPRLLGPMLELHEDDGPTLQTLYRQLPEKQSDAVLAFALRRLEAAGERVAPEDQLVDYWIALEALFGQASRRGDVLYRLALRMARFLEDDFESRKRLQGKVYAYYDVRSRVVHGDPTVDTAEAAKVRDRTEVLLRRALRRWLSPNVDTDMTVLELE